MCIGVYDSPSDQKTTGGAMDGIDIASLIKCGALKLDKAMMGAAWIEIRVIPLGKDISLVIEKAT